MHDSLLFSESLLFWAVANYSYSSDPARDDEDPHRQTRWFGVSVPPSLVTWSIGIAILLVLISGLGVQQFTVAAVVVIGSLTARWLRRTFVKVRNLMEFEIGLCVIATFLLHLITNAGVARLLPSFGLALSRGQWSVLCTGAALLVYMIQGGNYIVRGILKRAGGMPDATEPQFETREGYAHGRIIGQIERIIVVLVVMGGNLQALAFFFAAKGLIRSKELEERARADYFLLGSLASFVVGLCAGLILQQVIEHLWH